MPSDVAGFIAVPIELDYVTCFSFVPYGFERGLDDSVELRLVFGLGDDPKVWQPML